MPLWAAQQWKDEGIRELVNTLILDVMKKYRESLNTREEAAYLSRLGHIAIYGMGPFNPCPSPSPTLTQIMNPGATLS